MACARRWVIQLVDKDSYQNETDLPDENDEIKGEISGAIQPVQGKDKG